VLPVADERADRDDCGGLDEEDGKRGVPGTGLEVPRDRGCRHPRLQGRAGRSGQETGDQGGHHEHPGWPALGEQGPPEEGREDCADDQRGAVSPGEIVQPPGQVPAERGQHHFVPVEGEHRAR
jgi:hypothetical protein